MNSIVGDLPDKDPTIKRLLRNATDFAAAFQPFYGPTIAARFGELMKGLLRLQGNSFKHCTQAIPPPQQMHSDVGTQMPMTLLSFSAELILIGPKRNGDR
ncbi:hypothetical protein [Brevibacillus laterosporus]|uniref:hypothetical protein n=1 Tax=Brevibacillus laterosporus TaxID=1465 RepID=UPI001F488CBF|nr:hypothetical protein [Brevibacillus laterosporus]